MGNAAIKTPAPESGRARVTIKVVVDEQGDGRWSARVDSADLSSLMGQGATPEEAAMVLMQSIHASLEELEDAEDMGTRAARAGGPTETWDEVRRALDLDV